MRFAVGWFWGFFLASLVFSRFAVASPAVVECHGPGVTAVVDMVSQEAFQVRLRFPSGVGYSFATTGVIRSDRGFAAGGLRALVYTKVGSRLVGWAAVGQTIWKDLNCAYLVH